MICEILSPSIAFSRFYKLGGSIIIRHIEPEPMWDGSGYTFTHAEWIPTHKIGTLAVWIIQGIEEKWCWRGQQVCDMLLHCIDVLTLWILCYLWHIPHMLNSSLGILQSQPQVHKDSSPLKNTSWQSQGFCNKTILQKMRCWRLTLEYS